MLPGIPALYAGGLQKNFEIFAQTLGTFVPLLHPEDATDENEAGLSASPSSLSHTVQEMNVRYVHHFSFGQHCACACSSGQVDIMKNDA